MKKRIVMKKWVEFILIIIGIIMFVITLSDCENTLLFIASHLLAVTILLAISFMFTTYGRSS